jgi:NhaC family Na+:H+ antiporter
MQTSDTVSDKKKASVILAIIPILFLVGLLYMNVQLFEDSLGGANQIALLVAAALATFIGFNLGYSWKEILDGIIKSITSSLSAVLILLLIGALAGTWLISGIVPTMVYYGLQIMSPTYFLVATVLVCAIVSVATGSSWSTVATVGIALLGIGDALGIDKPMVAGAIISGAYFGDKMSPMSDTTNLAPAMAGTDLFTHIRYMTITTIPTLAITLLIFLFIGFNLDIKNNAAGIQELLTAIQSKFYISPVLFIVPLIVIGLILKKVDAIPALFVGALLGGVAAIIFQPAIIQSVSEITTNYAKASYVAVINAMTTTTEILTPNEEINDLLKGKGMAGMLNTIWLIVCAMCFGGVMEVCGLLDSITRPIVRLAKSDGSLIATTAGTCVFFNATASDQYLAIVVPGKMFSKTYKDRGLAPENLSRTLEDSGTVTSVLFPWNTCGAAQSSCLGVATGSYWMYCFFNILSPIMTVLVGYLGYRIKRIAK